MDNRPVEITSEESKKNSASSTAKARFDALFARPEQSSGEADSQTADVDEALSELDKLLESETSGGTDQDSEKFPSEVPKV